jgi:hypothetical protein
MADLAKIKLNNVTYSTGTTGYFQPYDYHFLYCYEE